MRTTSPQKSRTRRDASIAQTAPRDRWVQWAESGLRGIREPRDSPACQDVMETPDTRVNKDLQDHPARLDSPEFLARRDAMQTILSGSKAVREHAAHKARKDLMVIRGRMHLQARLDQRDLRDLQVPKDLSVHKELLVNPDPTAVQGVTLSTAHAQLAMQMLVELVVVEEVAAAEVAEKDLTETKHIQDICKAPFRASPCGIK